MEMLQREFVVEQDVDNGGAIWKRTVNYSEDNILYYASKNQKTETETKPSLIKRFPNFHDLSLSLTDVTASIPSTRVPRSIQDSHNVVYHCEANAESLITTSMRLMQSEGAEGAINSTSSSSYPSVFTDTTNTQSSSSYPSVFSAICSGLSQPSSSVSSSSSSTSGSFYLTPAELMSTDCSSIDVSSYGPQMLVASITENSSLNEDLSLVAVKSSIPDRPELRGFVSNSTPIGKKTQHFVFPTDSPILPQKKFEFPSVSCYSMNQPTEGDGLVDVDSTESFQI